MPRLGVHEVEEGQRVYRCAHDHALRALVAYFGDVVKFTHAKHKTLEVGRAWGQH